MVDSTLAQGTYEVLRNRLREGATDLRNRLEKLNAERSAVFGNLETKLLSTLHVTTEHNCIPRDLFAFGNTILLGCNVQFGLKSEILWSDVFSLYRYEADHASTLSLGPLEDPQFQRDFAELFRYYKNATFLRFLEAGPFLYMIFQTGKTITSFKAFKWAIDKEELHYIDGRSEAEIKPTPQTSFQWRRATRDSHRQGKCPHISIEDKLFVECVGGDLTIKIEDNTEDGLGIYREPVDNPDQTLDDAETFYAILDHLILLKVRPYQERDFRYLVYSSKRTEVQRLDGIGAACLSLPNDQGLIFPNGYVLQSGDRKQFEHGLTSLSFDSLRRSPNGEDFLYLFLQPESGIHVQLRYNLIRQAVDTPLVCHGQAFMPDGHMLSMRAEDQPQKHHAIQVWQTPFTSPSFRPAIQSDSYLFKIGNQDLVRGMSECQELLNLIDRDDSYAGLYSDLAKLAGDILDTYFWLDRPEAGNVSEPIQRIREAADAAVEEFDKVVRIRQQSEKALAEAQNAAEELVRKVDRQKFENVEQFVEGLASVRAQRGVVVQLKELRYIDLDAVQLLEKQLIEFGERFGNRCVQHLLRPESLQVYRDRIAEYHEQVDRSKTAADGKKIEESYNKVGESLELLIETVSQLRIEDTTQRTEIVDRISDVLAELNRDRARLRAHLREVVHRELDADYASQSKLLDQSMAGALEGADEPDKVDLALTRLLLQVEELEGRYADSDELLLRLTEKRQAIADAFEAKRVQLVETRTKRANGLVVAADRMIAGIQSKANRIDDPNELRAYFASDLMVERVRQIAEQLKQLGDSVRQEDVLSRLKSVSDDAMRQQRDRRELLSDGNRLITLGNHAFSVNQQATELTTVVRNGTIHLHITGTQYFEPIHAPELEESKDLWDAPFPSESPTVYRAETLAYLIATGNEPEKLRSLSEPEKIELIRGFMQSRYQDGYARGVHDLDAVKILDRILVAQGAMGLLTFPPALRATAAYAWSNLLDNETRQRFQEWILASKGVDTLAGGTRPSPRIIGEIEQTLASLDSELKQRRNFGNTEAQRNTETDWHHQAAEFLVQSIRVDSEQFPVSEESQWMFRKLLSEFREDQSKELSRWIGSERLGIQERWDIANRFAKSFYDSHASELEEQGIAPEYSVELAWLLIDRLPLGAPGVSPSVQKATPGETPGPRPTSGDRSARRSELSGMLGDHPLIQNGVLAFQYHDFWRRLTAHVRQTMPRWNRLQETKHRLSAEADKRIKTHDLKAKVLTSFVRNQLIDSVYLPRVGDNLAKQIGASGDNKRTDRMGLLLLISPPGYGKTTLMEYIANRLGLVFVKVNGPAIGHGVTSLDPAEAPNAASREEVERINLALEMGDNTMLYLDDIQHCNVELLQKFIPLCDATRRIEGVWKGESKTYDLRGRKFAVVMAGNPYNESGQRFQIPDMLANRADVYNLGEIIGDSLEAFEMSYLENCLTSNTSLLPLSRASSQDQRALILASARGSAEGIDLEANFSVDDVREMVSVLQKLNRVRDVVLTMNREYIRSAAQSDDYRTEPAFKLQGSYRNMNRIAEKVVPVMNDDELQRLILSSYEQDSQTLSRDGESNMLKFRELLGILTLEEEARWKSICQTFSQKTKLQGLSGDQATAQVLASMLGIQNGLGAIGEAISHASQLSAHLAKNPEPPPPMEIDQKVIVRHAVPRVMSEMIRSQFQLLYDGLRPILEEVSKQQQTNSRLQQSIEDCLARYRDFEAKAQEGDEEL